MSYFEDFEEYKIGQEEYEAEIEFEESYKFWTTREGEVLFIDDMKTSHIENCIRMLERKSRTNSDTYNYMKKVLKKRKRGLFFKKPIDK